MGRMILILVLLFCIDTTMTAQITKHFVISDTSKYLRDSIIPKTNYYIGKPLSVLLKDLKIKIKSYTGIIPFDYLPDTINFIETTLDFYTISALSYQIKNKIKTPNLHITFRKPILIPKVYFKSGNFLAGDWDSRKAAFFGNNIIASIEVRGLSPNKPPLIQNLFDTSQHH